MDFEKIITRNFRRKRFMRRKLIAFVLLNAVSLSIIGCQESANTTSVPSAPGAPSKDSISIRQLASSLNMQVSETNPAFVKLKNTNNTVLIFTSESANFFVNGEPKGSVGHIEKIGDDFFVSRSLLSKISRFLQTQPAWQYQPSRQPAPPRYFGGYVVVDAGHGGKDPGAISCMGSYEKYVNLSLALKTANLLESKGIKVILTRSNDTFVELEERAAIANRTNANLFVSIHCDSSHDNSLSGFSAYVAKGASNDSIYTANSILNTMSVTSLSNRGLRRADYRVLVYTQCPAVLVESGYLSNYRDASLLLSSQYQSQIARSIANGICQSLQGK